MMNVINFFISTKSVYLFYNADPLFMKGTSVGLFPMFITMKIGNNTYKINLKGYQLRVLSINRYI